MKTVTFTEFRSHASDILTQVENGETIIVLRHGRPVAEVCPVADRRKPQPSWKGPALRLSSKGADLASAILRNERVKAYLDSSSFAKRFVDEIGSDEVEAVQGEH